MQPSKLPSEERALVYGNAGKQAWARVTCRAKEGDELLTLLCFLDTQVASYTAMQMLILSYMQELVRPVHLYVKQYSCTIFS